MFLDPHPCHMVVGSGSEILSDYSIVSLTGNNTHRIRTTNVAVGAPNVMRMSHSIVGSGQMTRDRSLVRFEANAVEDAVEDPTRVASLYAVLDLPRTGFTDAAVTNLWKQFIGCIAGNSLEGAFGADQTYFFDSWLSGQS